MRKLIFTRRKTFIACLGKLKVYMCDATSNEIVINNYNCRLLGVVKNGETVFELGPLPYAMKHGMVYCADEYDFAEPAVLSIYQSVLEGKPLIIKEADLENRVIKPHPNFRFCATGNTNGAGDSFGLYQGTRIHRYSPQR